nr:unnamed protein product [Digitaria exilis]
MVAGSITQEIAMAVPAEPVWKAAFTADAPSMRKALAGMVDTLDVDGDGGPGSLITMKFNNPAAVGPAAMLKARVKVRDNAARVMCCDEVEGGDQVGMQFKSQVVQAKVEPAGVGGCVVKLSVDYERLDGTPLPPEDQAKLITGYVGLIKKVEENIVTHPGQFA